MAICGRCGLWNQYPEKHHEQKYAGVCIWYQMRLMDTDVWEKRECKDFFERIPGMHTMDHFDYKIKRDNLGEAYEKAKQAQTRADQAQKRANIGLVLSITGITITLIKFAIEVIHGG
jgi:hypothetical protein|tara:strand:+ start:687 stop:1037 length:351 start_codon:yes stop_codon:yes gene_type:complete